MKKVVFLAILLASAHQSMQKSYLPNWPSVPGVYPFPSIDTIIHSNVSSADIYHKATETGADLLSRASAKKDDLVSAVSSTKDSLVSRVSDHMPSMPHLPEMHMPQMPDLNPMHYMPEINILPKVVPKNYTIDPSIEEDASLSIPELIAKYGYKAEVHHVTTEDGYILELHRIAGSPKSPAQKGKKVIFIMHGFSVSSASFTLTGPHHGLGFKLADAGFDVWLGNGRGNIYSTNHTTLNPFGSRKEQNKYWYFTWHEMGIYDLPASIDYVLATTEESKLQFIGHSQGATSFFVMCSEKPEYNDKIEMMHALGPVAYLSNVDHSPIRGLAPLMPFLTQANRLVRTNYFAGKKPGKKLTKKRKELSQYEQLFQTVERKAMSIIMGSTSMQRNKTLGPVISGHVPAGSALLPFVHLGQLVQSGNFQQFDYGRIRNYMEYGHMSAPKYNLKNVTAPVAIYYAVKDWLTTVKDVQRLIDELPNVVHEFLITREDFNHNDFIYGSEAPAIVYGEIVKNAKSIHDVTDAIIENLEYGNQVEEIEKNTENPIEDNNEAIVDVHAEDVVEEPHQEQVNQEQANLQ